MRIDELIDAYFDWMYQLVIPFIDGTEPSYRKLLRYLNDVTFISKMTLDKNRASDGESLRYQFGYYCHVDSDDIGCTIDTRPCSVLEMMVALCIRMEDIAHDSNIGDRVPYWFAEMIRTLGLDGMDDEHFDRRAADILVRRFMQREYDPNGQGGLFYLETPFRDLRTVQIWYQMCWYLDTVLYK